MVEQTVRRDDESHREWKRLSRASALLRQRGYIVIAPAVAKPELTLVIGPLALDIPTRTLSFEQKQAKLTPFKFLLVKALMEAEGAWCSRRALRKLLWGDTVPDSDSLAVHMHYLRTRLQELTGMDVIQSSRRRGFRLAFDLFDAADPTNTEE